MAKLVPVDHDPFRDYPESTNVEDRRSILGSVRGAIFEHSPAIVGGLYSYFTTPSLTYDEIYQQVAAEHEADKPAAKGSLEQQAGRNDISTAPYENWLKNPPPVRLMPVDHDPEFEAP